MGFSDELRAAMDSAGLTAAELAAQTGLSEGAISYLRSGRRQPSYKSIRALADRAARSWPSGSRARAARSTRSRPRSPTSASARW